MELGAQYSVDQSPATTNQVSWMRGVALQRSQRECCGPLSCRDQMPLSQSEFVIVTVHTKSRRTSSLEALKRIIRYLGNERLVGIPKPCLKAIAMLIGQAKSTGIRYPGAHSISDMVPCPGECNTVALSSTHATKEATGVWLLRSREHNAH